MGYVFVIGFPAGLLSETAYQAMLTGMQSSMGVTFTTETISGVDVATGTSYHREHRRRCRMATTSS